MRFVASRCAFAKLNNEQENLLFLIMLITTYYINTTKRTILNVHVFQDRTEYADCVGINLLSLFHKRLWFELRLIFSRT